MRRLEDYTTESIYKDFKTKSELESILKNASVLECYFSDAKQKLLGSLDKLNPYEIKALDTSWCNKLRLLSLKYQSSISSLVRIESNKIKFRNIALANYSENNREILEALIREDKIFGILDTCSEGMSVEEALEASGLYGRKPWEELYLPGDIKFWNNLSNGNLLETLGKVRNYEYRNYVAHRIEDARIDYVKTYDGVHRFIGNVILGNMGEDFMRLRNLSIKKDSIEIEGAIGFYGLKDEEHIDIYPIDEQGDKIECSFSRLCEKTHNREHGSSMNWSAFRLDIPLDSIEEIHIRILAEVAGIKVLANRFIVDAFCPISEYFRNSYFYENGYVVELRNSEIMVKPCSEDTRVDYEQKLQNELVAKGYGEAAKLRTEAIELRKSKDKPIWLINDRRRSADDNGEAFFKFISNNHKDEVRAIFVIDSDTKDAERLSEYGEVVSPGTREHKILALACDVMLASYMRASMRNPFVGEEELFRDLMHHKYILMEHGVSHGKDFTSWMGRTHRMIDAIVVASKLECQEFCEDGYGYLDDELWACGLPRFDYLRDDEKNIITFAPTWNKSLTDGLNEESGLWEPAEDFANSEHATMYREIISNERLVRAAERLGYTLQFKPHPNFSGIGNCYGFDESVKLIGDGKSYNEIFAESSLMITDYSSVVYDFAYLHKPVIYLQIKNSEPDEIMHTYSMRADYSYEESGFGDVFTDVEKTVDCIIKYMESGCKLKDKYKKRIDSFFTYKDGTNCERLFRYVNGIL